jgi:hypothetical protein
LGPAAVSEEREHVLLLLAGGVRHGHEALGEPVAALALRAEAQLSPEDERTQLTLSVVVSLARRCISRFMLLLRLVDAVRPRHR